MHQRETAKDFLRTRFAKRLDRIRGVEPGGNWVGIQAFGLTFNELLPGACRLQCGAPGSAAEGLRSRSPSAATNSTE